MDFIDEVTFWAIGGRGGNGCVSFRREKFVPKGGPDGGDGGNGGHIVLRVNGNLSTLADLRHRKKYKAEMGVSGKSKDMHGRKGKSKTIHIPPGTIVKDADSGNVLGDLTHVDQELIVAHGGKGGKGNARFATSTLQAPDWAEEGKPGDEVYIKLELKLLADVGLVGFPNAGKSTLLSRISAAKPKIANYPFTTLTPNLGIVRFGEYQSFVVADIPGLIEGAHRGKGLGDRFLRHVERTRILLFLIDLQDEEPYKTFESLLEELKEFNAELVNKPRIVAFTKIDLQKDPFKIPAVFSNEKCYVISAVSGHYLKELIQDLGTYVMDTTNE